MKSAIIDVKLQKANIELSPGELAFFNEFLNDIDAIWRNMSCSLNQDFELIDEMRDVMLKFKDRYMNAEDSND
jgi:hypothetical protein